MSTKKLKWYIVNRDYINYIKQFDTKIQNIDYCNKSKPYTGIVFKCNNFNYYVPVSSVKSKHFLMSEKIDFIKIINNQKILSVINLNNMIPIPNNQIKFLDYKKIDKYYNFDNLEKKIKYIGLLRKELYLLNKKQELLYQYAEKIYSIKMLYPNSNIAKRCCNFQLLERKCLEYNKFQ